MSTFANILLLDILNYMDQDLSEVAAEAAIQSICSPTLTLDFSGHSKTGSGSRERKILVDLLFYQLFFSLCLRIPLKCSKLVNS